MNCEICPTYNYNSFAEKKKRNKSHMLIKQN